MPRALDRMAARVADDPRFLAFVLAAFARAERLDDAGLAARLGCAMEMLGPLRLCLRPRDDQFGADVREIADHFALSPMALAQAVRRADALLALSAPEGDSQLLAARDHAGDAEDGEHVDS